MLRQIALRLAVAVGTLAAVSVLVFLGTEALPGDAATATLGRAATPELVELRRREFGLDRPLPERYASWLAGLPRGDLGRSIPSGEPVTSLIGDKARNTAMLSLVTIAFLVPFAVVLGIASAVRHDRPFDHGVASTTLALIATPEFVVGSLLVVVFAVVLGILPPVSLVDPSAPVLSQADILVLPVATLLAAAVAQTIRMIRASMIDVLESDYIELARLKGVPERRLLFRHALPNALGPTIQVIAINVAWLAGGVVVVESVFQYPGVGLTLAKAVSTRDLPTIQALALLITAVYVTVNILADIVVILLNPRLRRA